MKISLKDLQPTTATAQQVVGGGPIQDYFKRINKQLAGISNGYSTIDPVESGELIV